MSAKALALWGVAAGIVLLLAATSTQLGLSAQRRVLLQSAQPLAAADLSSRAAVARAASRGANVFRHSGKVEGEAVKLELPGGGAAAAPYRSAYQLCRDPDLDAPPLPQLQRVAGWEGDEPSKDGNATIVTTLHAEQLPLLEVHCAVWPHKIVAAVYAPLSPSGHVLCADQMDAPEKLRRAGSWLARLGIGGGGACPLAGWSVAQLQRHVRATQRRAQKTGLCNLQLELWTEMVTAELMNVTDARLLPQASLQNIALQMLPPQGADSHHAVVLLDGDMVSVDVWQLVNWPSRWERALQNMQEGRMLVLPGFQLSPEGAAAAARQAPRGAHPHLAAMQQSVNVITAEAGKFPLLQLYQEGHARVLRDRGFASSQDAVLPDVWFEAGDMHGAPDDGYPVLPAAGFAPFAFMLQRHVPWADERLRGSYYQRAWQAMAARVMGLRHFVVPNAFAMQLPHPDAYDRAEARIATFQAMEPVLRQLAAEAGTGTYVPVTSFAGMCAMAAARAAGSAH